MRDVLLACILVVLFGIGWELATLREVVECFVDAYLSTL